MTEKKTKLWLTYAWLDNENLDVDYIARQIETRSIDVKLDRRQLVPGQRIWSQIDRAISDSSQTDAWAILVTKNSLISEPCQEELAYALDRALRSRGSDFPLIGLFPEHIDRQLVPSAIATRLYVDLRDNSWVDKVVAGAQSRSPSVNFADVPPFHFAKHFRNELTILEVRPRVGRWNPCTVAVPFEQKGFIRAILFGPSGGPPVNCGVGSSSGVSDDGKWWIEDIIENVDALSSVYIVLEQKPSQLVVGHKQDMYNIIPRLMP